jgi:hypothetical protein
MTTLGLCTNFSQTDEWAFEYALQLARMHGWQLNICHWLNSPYTLRRDVVADDLFDPTHLQTVTPALLTRLELQLRQYYDSKLGDFTDVAFKLCEGQYQVELVRCMRNHLLDLVVMGYQSSADGAFESWQPLEIFAAYLPYPIVLVGQAGPQSFLINTHALDWLDQLELPEGGWKLLQPEAERV